MRKKLNTKIICDHLKTRLFITAREIDIFVKITFIGSLSIDNN